MDQRHSVIVARCSRAVILSCANESASRLRTVSASLIQERFTHGEVVFKRLFVR